MRPVLDTHHAHRTALEQRQRALEHLELVALRVGLEEGHLRVGRDVICHGHHLHLKLLRVPDFIVERGAVSQLLAEHERAPLVRGARGCAEQVADADGSVGRGCGERRRERPVAVQSHIVDEQVLAEQPVAGLDAMIRRGLEGVRHEAGLDRVQGLLTFLQADVDEDAVASPVRVGWTVEKVIGGNFVHQQKWVVDPASFTVFNDFGATVEIR
mmetsp:Transcript_5015/g.8697  ORF Transcript_5015/g.8697 Transcript_5015/m.8697 type:complete len:213 (+) Transcript_5015:62-700(+)